jgi:CHASE2 domain-containing sensor protein
MLATAVGRTPELPPSVLQSGAAATLHKPHRINFYGPAGTFRRLSLTDIINGDYPPEFFQNRYVLVGLTATGIVDEVATPFSQDRNRMPGIEVHANVLENLLDGTMVREVPDSLRWLAALTSTLLLAFFFRRLHEVSATILCALAVSHAGPVIGPLCLRKHLAPPRYFCRCLHHSVHRHLSAAAGQGGTNP